jgi:CRISPR/Cas system-associated endoribonuclease Cas2
MLNVAVRKVPLTSLAIEAFKNQMAISGAEPYLFPSDLNPTGHLKKLKTVWTKTLRRAKIPYFRIYDLRSAYATRLSAGGVADEWVTQLLRQSDAQVFKKYSQMKLRMKREALEKLNRRANEMVPTQADTLTSVPLCTEVIGMTHSCTVRAHCARITERSGGRDFLKSFAIGKKLVDVAGIEPATPCLQSTKLYSNNSTGNFNY